MVENIAIIGAGWAGMQIGKILIDCGYKVTIYEELNDVGGTWHPDKAYYGLSIHTALYSVEFYNFPVNNKFHERLKRLKAEDIFTYNKSFASEMSLYKHCHFKHKVTSINYISETKKAILNIVNLDTGESGEREFDFVIATPLNITRLPVFDGSKNFKGKIYHVNDIKKNIVDDIVATNKNVILLGGSKAATDMAYMFALRNFKVSWVLRQMYWFISYDKRIYNHETGKESSLFYRICFFLGVALFTKRLTVNIGFWFLIILGLLKCPGKFNPDFKKFHAGHLDEHQLHTLKYQTNQIYSEISALKEHSVTLKNGQEIDCDVIICATGCDVANNNLELKVNGNKIDYVNDIYIYKYSVVPAIPILCFTGFLAFSLGPTNYYHRAAWILKYLEINLSSEELLKIAKDDVKKYGNWCMKNGNALFDSSYYLFLRVSQQTRQSILGHKITNKDILLHVYDYYVKQKLKPFKTAIEYVQSKTKQRSEKY